MIGPRSWPPHGPDLDAEAEAQAEVDYWHSPAWSAHEDEIDRLREQEAREMEVGA
jgi:hypothetical protein